MLPAPPKSSEKRAIMLLFAGDQEHFWRSNSGALGELSYDLHGDAVIDAGLFDCLLDRTGYSIIAEIRRPGGSRVR
jgi:hypothetical protein